MISIIIPVYNEENTIKGCLENIPFSNEIEVIVVDGESFDKTIEIASQYPVRVIKSIKNRAIQLNEGARQAKADKFLFLYADCRLENGSLDTIEANLRNDYIGGCLSQRIDSRRLVYRVVENSGNLRARSLKIFYGDQAIFVRRDAFFKIGGFDKVDLFDDAIFSKKLKDLGRTCVLKNKVYSSARRWQKQGIIRATLINWLMTVGFIFGISSEKLKRLYDDVR